MNAMSVQQVSFQQVRQLSQRCLQIASQSSARRLHVLKAECPKCPDPDPASPAVKACREGPRLAYEPETCKWADWKAERDQYEVRVARLRQGKLGHPRWEKLLAGSDAPPAPPAALFETEEDRLTHAACRDVVARFVKVRSPQVLTLVGQTGSGKSLLAAWAACRFSSPLWAYAPRAGSFEDWDPIVAALPGASMVVVDDLGFEARSASEFAQKNLSTFICGAINSGKSVILTTNLMLDGEGGIASRFDPRLASRLREFGEVWGLGNTDLRTARRTT